ncbi:hypothetical protein IBK40_27800, partial [Escherichia coli]|nr:hypothetical protein [Escherichia coli]
TEVFARIKQIAGQEHIDPLQTEIGSMVYAVKPGDGSARKHLCQLADIPRQTLIFQLSSRFTSANITGIAA